MKNRRNYIVLLLLSLLFAAPGVSAYFFYTHPAWLSNNTTNKGGLLTPSMLLTYPHPTKAHPKWRFVLWSPVACEKNCTMQLDKLARIRLALGRRLYDVDGLLLLGHDAPSLPHALIKTLNAEDIQVAVLPAREQQHMPRLQNHLAIYIANPDNYLVLTYPPEVAPNDIYRDIKQLLTK